MKPISLILISLVVSLEVFGQKKFFNENYKLQRQEIKIALIPFRSSDILYTETISETLLQDSLPKVKLADIKLITHNILTDSSLNETLRRVIAKEYLSKELKHSPNLSQFINKDALTNMKRKLDTSDILLTVSDIKTKKVYKLHGTGNTTVYGNFKLYDLNTGEFIFDFFAKKKVKYLILNDTKKIMTVLLEDFHSYYFTNFIVRNNLN